jgi:hypothetical protein
MPPSGNGIQLYTTQLSFYTPTVRCCAANFSGAQSIFNQNGEQNNFQTRSSGSLPRGISFDAKPPLASSNSGPLSAGIISLQQSVSSNLRGWRCIMSVTPLTHYKRSSVLLSPSGGFVWQETFPPNLYFSASGLSERDFARYMKIECLAAGPRLSSSGSGVINIPKGLNSIGTSRSPAGSFNPFELPSPTYASPVPSHVDNSFAEFSPVAGAPLQPKVLNPMR